MATPQPFLAPDESAWRLAFAWHEHELLTGPGFSRGPIGKQGRPVRRSFALHGKRETGLEMQPAGCSVGNEAANERKAVELPHVQPREAGVMGASLNRAASRVSLVIIALAVAGLMAFGDSQASASHVSCGDTITADTTLDSDLVNCENNGIVIGADDITLDLNGHLIDGDGTEFAGCPKNEWCDFGLLNDGHDGVTLRGGSVRDFHFGGVLVVAARHNRVADLTVSRNAGTGIILFRSSRNTLIRNSARANGLQLDQGGISLNRSHHNLIKRNDLRRNGDLGLFMEISDQNQTRKNRMRGNPEGGVIAEGRGNVFNRNRIVRGGGGILITKITDHGAVGNVVRRNMVRNVRAAGIAVDPRPKRTVIKRNHVVGSGRAGIGVGSPSTTITRNRAVRNDGLGIKAVEGVIDGGGNIARHNGDPRQCVNVTCH